MAAPGESKPDIILNSPVGSKPAVYKWPLTYISKGQKIDGAEEIIETIRWVAREYVDFKSAIENLLPEQPDLRSYECIKSLCDKYNKITDFVMKMNKGTSVSLKTSSRASVGLLKHIIQQVYNYAVADPNELNKYPPFSSETYGETSFEFMAQLIERNQFKPSEDAIFIDMGSGVGHIVLQMAASVKCKKCYGIEIADVPAGYAKIMQDRFKFWMNWHGKTYTEFELFHGDFFEKKYNDIIKSATHILVNNFAFKPEVDHKLKQKFLDLKDGAQILSSKPICAPKSRVTERHLSDIGSLMHVVEIQPDLKKDTVSWTHKPLPYYLHVLDSSRVERYYERKNKRRCSRSAVEKGKPTKRRKTGKGSDSLSDDSDDNTVYGPTTRKAWSEWCNASSNLNSSNRVSTDSAKTASSRNNSTDTETCESAIDEDNTAIAKNKDTDIQKRDRKIDTQNSAVKSLTTASQETSAQTKNTQSSGQAPKSCLDKKRDYAIKKSGSNLLQSAPPSALYSISKPADTTNGSSSTSKIPNIVIKVKPQMEAKVVDSSEIIEQSPSPEKMIETKVNDENGKKLRQRKKPATVHTTTITTTNTTTMKQPPNKSGGTSRIESKSTASILSTNTNGLRPKKAPAPTKTPAKSTAASKKKSATPADKVSSLDLLHAKTVESVSKGAGFYAQPAPGCADHKLKSITETPSLPKVVIKDPSMYVSSSLGAKNIEKFVNDVEQEFRTFAKKIQQPSAREALVKSIEQERIRNKELHKAMEDLTEYIKILTDRIPISTKVHCDDLGIKNTPRSMVNHLGVLLRKHQDLLAYQLQLENSLNPNHRTLNPPAAHSNNNPSSYRNVASACTLDLSLKQ